MNRGVFKGFVFLIMLTLSLLSACTVKIEKKPIAVESIELNKSSLSLTEGDSETLVATIKPSDAEDKSLIWSSSDENVATVDGKGKVTAIKAGEAIIKAKSGNIEAACSVTVKPDGTPAGGLEGTGEEEMH